MELKFQVSLKVRRPVPEVFDAVVNPGKLSGYFIQDSSGPLAEGTTVKWQFAEFPDGCDVEVLQNLENERLVLEWEATEGGYPTRVEMDFKRIDAENTLVQVAESGWRQTPAGLGASYGNCGGWMHMLACLKAYLEYGINLRAGGVQ